MREIKFRAWHKEKKLMYRVLSLVFGQREQEATLVRYEGPYITCPLDEIELMQFTGLTDKNGKKIYEGDIVKAEHWWEEPHALIWPEDMYWVIECNLTHRLEVIGNIHENPELVQQ